MKKIIFCLFCFSFFVNLQAQNKYSEQLKSITDSYNQDKLDALYNETSERQTQQKEEAITYALLNNIPVRYENEDGVLFDLQYIDEDGTPIYYTTYNINASISTRANYLNTGGGLGLNLNGDDLTAHVWDGGLARLTHQEYDGAGGSNRFSIGDGTSALSSHSAHVTGTIMASGVQANAKGMAWQADAVGYDWDFDVSEATTAAGNGMLVSNHSYGYIASGIPDDWFGQYGNDARDWDQIMYNAPFYLMMVAAGNDGNDNSSNGSPLDGNSSYDKLSGHATAKNNLVVANGQDANINGDGSLSSVTINSGSSEGPTDDYRIKPDITGNGTFLYSSEEASDSDYGNKTGTSMASPNVTGTLLLLQEHYNNLNGGFMRAATLKGLALHTADDAGPNGPDAVYGWGLLNAKKATETLTTAAAGSGSAIVDEITLNQGNSYQITVQSNGTDPLMASISWTDPAGAINGGTNSNTPALVNDLDIRLDNGGTFTPWRLTSITTNGTGDNNVDPYERIDVNGASGQYTLTVTHKGGSLSGGAQNFSLIVTGIVVASTPVISYSSTSMNSSENTDCDFTEINIPLNIALSPAANATVNFTVNGGSTATNGLDFDIVTPSIVFLSGISDPVNLELRIYHDGFIEGDETIIIDFDVVNDVGGDATADLNADTLTLTISDDDLAPVSTQTVTIFDENMEAAPYEITTNQSGDGSNAWGLANASGASSSFWNTTGNSTVFGYTNDDACNCDKSNDLLTTTEFSLVGLYSSATLTFNHAFSDVGAELGDVLVSTGGAFATVLSLSNTSINTGGDNYTTPWVNNVTVDMTPYIGQATVRVQFRYNDGGGWLYGMAIDDILITAVTPNEVQTTVNTGTSQDQIILPTSGTIYTSDSILGDVMLDITNNQSDDYGCLEVSVSRAGTDAQPYNGSVAPDLVMDKIFEISTSNSVPSGDTSITFYFTEAEIAGWEAVTGLPRTDLNVGREEGGSIVEVSVLTIGAFGTNVTLTGAFTGLKGDFYFGTATAFGSCFGLENVWSGSWSLGVPPTNVNNVVFSSNYNTTSGDIDACSCEVDASSTVIISPGDYIKIEGNITVNGTLTIEHEGSLVQVDDAAIVTNNGTINVKKTTPVSSHDSFSILGSPMSGTTRDVEYASNNVVMSHDTNLFNLDPLVTAVNSGAVHFADVEGDNWSLMSGAASINVSEGYLVGPTTPSVGSGFYELNYNQGTLNNGVYIYTAILHIDEDNSANVLSNPYASAIDARDFITANSSIIDVVYFWEHLTPPLSSYPGYRFENWDMGDISLHNGTMGNMAPNGGTIPSHFIPSGQGFAIKAKIDGMVTFNNAMRVTGPNTGYRNNEALDKIYLKVENPTYHLQSSTGIGFIELATDGYESKYDTKRLATPVSIYSIVEDYELALQGRSTFNEGQVIPIGFRTMVEEPQIYTISLSSLEGEQITEATVYLQDNLLNTMTNLSEQNYTFTSNESNQKDRFVIVFTEEVLGTNDFIEESISIYPNPTQDYINIVSPLTEITSLTLYDVRRRAIQTKKVSNQTSYQLDMSNLETSMYFVKINTQNGSITKQIIKQ